MTCIKCGCPESPDTFDFSGYDNQPCCSCICIDCAMRMSDQELAGLHFRFEIKRISFMFTLECRRIVAEASLHLDR